MDKHIKWIVNQWKREKWFVLLMLVFTLASSAVSIAYPILFGRLLDLLKNILGEPAKYPNPMQEINRIIWVFVALGFAQFITGFYPAIRGWMNIRFENFLRKYYFKFVLTKDFRFFHKFRTGDIVTRLT
ncbi:MAG TPA: ABC transporter transmembrane domain-containing protein, partial [Candidatus Syntrophosphaera thermopropionivorans]|nr:ABC transporter transmembrane domain-containing protein [Candidatus Syntrophosphaera thermopropionivorans]